MNLGWRTSLSRDDHVVEPLVASLFSSVLLERETLYWMSILKIPLKKSRSGVTAVFELGSSS